MELRIKIDSILKNMLVGLMAAMVINVLWQVTTRFIVGSPSSFTDELSRYLLIWVGVLGAAYASGKRLHVAIDLLSSKMTDERQKHMLKVLIALLIIMFVSAVFVIGGARLVYITFILKQNSAALQIPLAYVYLVIPLSGLLIIYYKLSEIFRW